MTDSLPYNFVTAFLPLKIGERKLAEDCLISECGANGKKFNCKEASRWNLSRVITLKKSEGTRTIIPRGGVTVARPHERECAALGGEEAPLLPEEIEKSG